MSNEYDGYLINLALQELEKSEPERGPIDVVWRAVNDGKLSDADAAHWAQIIAQRVVRDVIDNKSFPEERPRRALKALGMYNVIDHNYEERRALELFLEFQKFSQEKNHKLSWPARLYKFMVSAGFYEGVPVRNAKASIDRLVKDIAKKSL